MVVVRKVFLLALCVLVPLSVSAQQSTQAPSAPNLTTAQKAQIKLQVQDAVKQQIPPTATSVSIYEIFIDANLNLLAHAAVTMSDNSVQQLVGTAVLTIATAGTTAPAGSVSITPVATASLDNYTIIPVPASLCVNGLLRVAQYSWNGQSRGLTAACHKQHLRAGFFGPNGQHVQIYQLY